MGVYLLTGAAGGIGKATVTELGKREHDVISVVRSSNDSSPGIMAADLSLMSEVNRIAAELLSGRESLDGVLLNAGVAPASMELTSEGIECSFAVNHLGAFLLAHKLLPLLQNAEQGRIVLTGSSDHMSVTDASVDALARGDEWSYTGTYARSKAVAMAAMLEMADRLRPAVPEEVDVPNYVLANVADPGWTRTGLTRNAPTSIRWLVRLGRPLQNRVRRSGRVLADLASEIEESGTYTGIKGPLTPSVLLRDENFCRKSYDDSVRLLVDRGFAQESEFLPQSPD